MSYIGNTNTTQAFTPAIDYFSGTGSATAFTLSKPVASVAQVQVVVNNVAQNPSSAYSVSSNTITFTSAPSAGTNNIYVYYTSPITQVIAPSQGTVTSSSFGVITDFATTGNTVLGDATTDTLTVGVTGIVKDASGNVGIGTASPLAQSQLTVASKSLSITGSDGNFSSGGARAMVDFAGGTQMRVGPLDGGTATATTLAFLTSPGSVGGNERMRIDSSGNLLVATTDSSITGAVGMKFDVNGTSPQIAICGSATTNAQITYTLYSTGAAAYRFYVDYGGTIHATSTSITAISDATLKTNIRELETGLSQVLALKPRRFDWINGDDTNVAGFIAQEVEQVLPELVSDSKYSVDENGDDVYKKNLKMGDILPTLVKAIQEQQALITALTARIEALENK